MSLKGLPNVLDIRPVGLTVGIDLASKPDAVGKRGYAALEAAYYDHDLMLRAVGDTLALCAAADRQRKSDRRDLRQDRQDHQTGGVAALSFRGASEGREPEIQNPGAAVYNSGSAAFAASRNDEQYQLALRQYAAMGARLHVP